jgi:inosine/xanthosine triphosphatase
MLVVVGSTNPTKIEPVEKVFSHHFTDVVVKGVAVESGVSDQPMSEDEMYQGALNRAQRALELVPDSVYGVGIEGGLHRHSYGWFERSLVVIVDTAGNIGIGASGGLVLPQRVMTRIQAGKNLEEAMDELFDTEKIGSGIGMFGIMTKGVVTRSSGVEHGVAFALGRFLHDGLYQAEK